MAAKFLQMAMRFGSSKLANSNFRYDDMSHGVEPIPQMKLELPTRKMSLTAIQSNMYDVRIIGGGEMAAGCALDAATRGLETALVEGDDFANGISSKSSTWDLSLAIRRFDRAAFRRVPSCLLERSKIGNLALHLNQPVPNMPHISLVAGPALPPGALTRLMLAPKGRAALIPNDAKRGSRLSTRLLRETVRRCANVPLSSTEGSPATELTSAST